MERKDYEIIVDRILGEGFLPDDIKNKLLDRLELINNYVIVANNSSNHNLRSTQVISWIVFDFIRSYSTDVY